ncbi:MAG: phage tail sheath family protein [Synergistaceae bacterium]|nr:phage tail sheath family protein [Synergistaceae bacterium]MBR0316524.1 phage tail sheath family protein [Synergistaceae bacterium]
MAFYHGVSTREVPTSLIPPAQMESGLPVIVGTAPIHLASDEDALNNVNKPKLIYSYDEAVLQFGFSKDWEKYTLCEFIYSQFALYAMSPCVLINVLDPNKHKEKITAKEFNITDGEVNLGADVLISDSSFEAATIVIEDDETESKVIYKLDEDYTLDYDDEGNAIFSVIEDGALANKATVSLTYTKLKPENITSNDIIGGVTRDGDYTGLELVNSVFPKFRLVPGLLGCPKWSEKPEVAAVMRAKAENINGIFSAVSVVDIPSDSEGADVYTEVPEWKNRNNYMLASQIVCWPKIKLGDDVYHFSTQLIGLMNSVDHDNEDIPYESPSNHSLQMNACVNAAGKEIDLGLDQANYLNSQGITTALNWQGGWKAWNNRTAVYPAVTDVKDTFIPIRRMFCWIRNEFILTFWQKVDAPITPRLIKTIVNSFNIRLNGLAAREFILGGRIEFQTTENPITDLMDGHLRFHIYFTPPSPAEQITGIFEYDPAYVETLFAAVK